MIRVGEGKVYTDTVYKKKISEIGGVEEVYVLFGQYDFIAKVQAENVEGIIRIVDNEIRTIPGVKSTETFIAY